MHAAAFVAEKFPAPAGPDPVSVGGAAEYGAARDTLSDAYVRETGAAHAGWSAGVRDRARGAGTPGPGDVPEAAVREGARTETDMIVRGSARQAKRAGADPAAPDRRVPCFGGSEAANQRRDGGRRKRCAGNPGLWTL